MLPERSFRSMQMLSVFISMIAALSFLVSCNSKPYPLAEPGTYQMGKSSFDYVDSSRGDRPIRITLWYPAVLPEGTDQSPRMVVDDAPPDASGAPYPLLLSSYVMAETLASYVVSHGFVWASVERINTYRKFDRRIIDQPLDILFTLRQMAEDPPEGFEKMIDAEHAGTIGYSFDGTNSFSLSGARVDPQYYLSQCPEPDETTKAFVSYLSAFDCAPAEAWEEMEDAAGEMITASQDGLWQPITDDRIRAVMPMAGEGWWWFGERGLAAADRPMLLLAGTADELYKENALIYEHLGTADKRFISYIGQGHREMLDEPQISWMAHLTNAFFGYHLQGKTELEKYFSEKYISGQDGLHWGVYSDE